MSIPKGKCRELYGEYAHWCSQLKKDYFYVHSMYQPSRDKSLNYGNQASGYFKNTSKILTRFPFTHLLANKPNIIWFLSRKGSLVDWNVYVKAQILVWFKTFWGGRLSICCPLSLPQFFFVFFLQKVWETKQEKLNLFHNYLDIRHEKWNYNNYIWYQCPSADGM